MEISRTALLVDEVSVYARFVDAIKLALEAVQVGFAERPGLRKVHLFEVVAELDKFVVGVLEAFVDFSLPEMIVSWILQG